MDDDQFDDDLGSSAPVFVNTRDLVQFSLGIDEEHGEGQEEEMEVAYQDDATSASSSSSAYGSSSAFQSSTQGLSSFYNVSEEDEQVRNITNEYLEGRLSLLEFASAMEHFGKLGAVGVDADADDEEDESTSGAERPRRPVPSLVLLTPETMEFSSGPQPSTSQQMFSDADDVKLKGEFFRSGDEPATFSVRKRRKMPPTIKNLMGEAHVRFAKGDLSGAETICMEVIKEQPTYKDPFHTLAMIYESQGNRSKSLQFYLICALLDPKRFDDWPRLAEMSIEEENTQQAIMCLNKALTSEPTNVKLHLRRCQLLKETGDSRGALRGYQKVHQMTTDGKTKMDVAKEIAHLYFQMDEIDNAYGVLKDTFNQFPEQVTFYELNLLSEVCITVKKYVEALSMFVQHSNLQFTPPLEASDFSSRSAVTKALGEPKRDCKVQPGLHSDLIQKIVIVLIHLEAFRYADQIVNRLLAVEDINEFGLQFFEIAEAYIAKKENRAALRLLNPLINSENYSEAEVWLRYAECLYMINKLEDAAEAYEKVISLAPNHKIAKLNLSIILQRLGKYDGALESLDQNDMEDLIDHDLLLERCKIFLSRGRLAELYDTATQLFSRHCPRIRGIDEAEVLITTSHAQQQIEGLKNLRLRKEEPILDSSVEFEEKPFENPYKEWRVYIMICRIFLYMGRFDLLARLTFTAWASKLFASESQMKQELDFHCALATTINNEQELTPMHYRYLFHSYRLNTVQINMLGLAFRKGVKFKYGRQIIRLLKKHPTDIRMMLLSAHNSFITGTYKYALIEYLQIITEIPTNALCHLMVAITIMHMVSQRTTSNRLRLVLYMLGFLKKYVELRGRCQESYYNLARAYHFIGFHTHALRFYKKVLTTKPVEDDKCYGGIPCKEDGSMLFVYGNQLDLKQEAAYNIAHIYRHLGLPSHARAYIFKYITI